MPRKHAALHQAFLPRRTSQHLTLSRSAEANPTLALTPTALAPLLRAPPEHPTDTSQFTSTTVAFLRSTLDSKVSRAGTQELYYSADPSRPAAYYRECTSSALHLTELYKLACVDSTGDDDATSRDSEATRQHLQDLRTGLWTLLIDVFIKAFFSGPDPEAGARYVAGVLLLSCGRLLRRQLAAGKIVGRGWDHNCWAGGIQEPDREWGWVELRGAVMATKEWSGRVGKDGVFREVVERTSTPRGSTSPGRCLR